MKVIKYNFLLFRFFRFFLIFVLIFAWIFSGFPRIWQNPRIPPKIQEAEAATVTLRPNADDAVAWTAKSGGAHYLEVYETTKDDDTSYIVTASSNAIDEFQLGDTSQTGTINSVTVRAWARSEAAGNDDQLFVLVQHTAGAVYLSTTALVPDTTYVEHTFTWTQNPQTLAAWTWSEINTLRAGVKYVKVGAAKNMRVTQVYVVVDYTSGLSTAIEIRAQNYTSSVSTITFPEGASGTTVSQPYNNIDSSGNPQTFGGAGIAKPVVTLYNGGASTLTIWYNITTFTNSIVSSEYYLINAKGAACADANAITNAVTFDTNTTTGTTITAGAGNEKDLYLKVTLSAVAGKTGTSTLTILGETL